MKRKLPVVLGDLLYIPLSYVAAYYIRLQLGLLESFKEIIPFSFLVLIPFIYVGLFYFFDLYELRKNFFTFYVFVNLCISLIASSIVVSFLKYGLYLQPIGRGILVLANLLILVLAFGWRNFCQRLLKRLIVPKRVVVLGAGKAGQEIARAVETNVDEFHVLGFLDKDESRVEKDVGERGAPILGV